MKEGKLPPTIDSVQEKCSYTLMREKFAVNAGPCRPSVQGSDY